MTTDTLLTTLRSADPLTADHPDLAPDSAAARRVRVLALTASPGRRALPVSGRLVRGGAALAACAAVGGVFALGGPGGPGTLAVADARAALVSAAERTAAFESGRVTVRSSAEHPTGPYAARATNVVRFAGGDVALETETTERGVGPDGAAAVHRGAYRLVGGRAFSRDGSGPWTTVPSPAGAGPGAPTERPAPGAADPRSQFRDGLAAADALAGLARRAPDVASSTRGGVSTYRASVSSAEVPQAFGTRWSGDGGRVAVEVEVAEEDAVRRVVLREPHRTIEVTYDALGEDQGITAP